MRLWSIHPEYLDSKGLVALWREALLAQNVLLGRTRGYKNHPQLIRFKHTRNPVGAIATYLRCVADEADRRAYQFDRTKIANKRVQKTICVTRGQIDYELNHLLRKLEQRDVVLYVKLKNIHSVKLHPLFVEVKGGVEDWEVVIS